MRIWLDTADIHLVAQAQALGLLHGVTTNPSIIAASGSSLNAILDMLLSSQPGPVAVQVTQDEACVMVDQAREFHAQSSRIIVKIPLTLEGLKAISTLREMGIPTMATAIFHPRQVLLAAIAGASFAAPYIRGIHEAYGTDPFQVVRRMSVLLQQGGFSTQILAASLRSVEDVLACVELGLCAATLKPRLFEELVANAPETEKQCHKFAQDWQLAKT